MKRNITVQLDEEVIDRAKVLAARRGTSVSALLSQQVIKMTEEATRYEAAKQRALAMMDEISRRPPRDSEKLTWTREELYDRDAARKEEAAQREKAEGTTE